MNHRKPSLYPSEVLGVIVYIAVFLLNAPIDLMPKERVAVIKSILPAVECRLTEAALNSEVTIWYDDESLPASYQDMIPPVTGLRTAFSPLAPDEIFTGGRFRYPWGHTAGTDRCNNCETIKFLTLPVVDEYVLPIVWWRDGLEYRWVFPRGTVAGEVLFQRNSIGGPYVFEIRTRTKKYDQWDVDVFRPFPRADHFAKAVADKPGLVKFASDTTTAKGPFVLRDNFGVQAQTGYVDVLPNLEEDLVERLLTETKFKSCHGEHWKAVDNQVCHCPTSNQEFNIVPGNYDAGMLEVSDKSCARCHETTSAAIGTFDGARVLYGRIWGSDSNFSFSILNPSQAQADAQYAGPAVDLHPAMIQSNLIKPFDANVHLEEFYHRTEVKGR